MVYMTTLYKLRFIVFLLILFVYKDIDASQTLINYRSDSGYRTPMVKLVGNSDLSKLVGIKSTSAAGYVFISTDEGMTWATSTSAGSKIWKSLAISANGLKIAAAGGGYVYISNDGGSTWATSTTALGSKSMRSVNMSDNGLKLFMTTSFDNNYYSNDGGSTWQLSDLIPGIYDIDDSIDMSKDGTKIIAYDAGSSDTFYSTTSGSVWINIGALPSNSLYYHTSSGLYSTKNDKYIYKSTNNGLSFSQINSSPIIDIHDGTDCYFDNSILLSEDEDKIFTICSGSIYFSRNSISSSTLTMQNMYSNNNGTYFFDLVSNIFWDSDFTFLKNSDDTKFLIYPKISNKYKYTVDTRYTLPIISNVQSVAGTSTANISLNTDVKATSSIAYGFGLNLNNINIPNISKYNASTTIDISLSNLLPCTTYTYRTTVGDIYDNLTSTPYQSFKTSGCLLNTESIQSTSTNITTGSGGALNLKKIRLVVPAGYTSTSSSAQFEVTEIATSTIISSLGTPTGYSLVNDLYQLQSMPTATTTLSTFDNPLYVVMTYDPDSLGQISASSLQIFSTDGVSWSPLSSCATDTSLHTVTCQTTHFSTFGMFGSITQPVVTSVRNWSLGSSSNYIPESLKQVATNSLPVFKFKKDLRLGNKNEDVRNLQKYLNNIGFTISKSGPGSKGNETNLFGPATKSALIKFQKSKGLPATGFFGPMTRGVIK